MNKTLLDNSDGYKMVAALQECISNPEVNNIRIATGYWDLPGMALIKDHLKDFFLRPEVKMRLLIGKDPYVYANILNSPKYVGKSYPDDFIRTDINSLVDNLKDEYKEVINLLLTYCSGSSPQLEIHIFKNNETDESQFLHSKCYIMTCGDNVQKAMHSIIGSSNFTEKGLQDNAELNTLENDPYFIASTHEGQKAPIRWFDDKWEQSEDWTKEFLEQVLRTSSPVKLMKEEGYIHDDTPAEDFTPYELYIKLLQLKFGDVVDKDLGQQIEAYLPDKISRLEYQIEAVKRCIGIMHEHGGFLLADVVGLGKTIIGTLIIKRFLSVPEDDGRERKVLLITPPAIQSGWMKTIDMFDNDTDEKILPYVDFITTGRINNVTGGEEWDDGDGDDTGDTGAFDVSLQEKNYGLIVIDESHKFRNSDTIMYQQLDELIQKIGADTGEYPYVGLLSATPQNNRPNELKNQIFLFERDHKESTLKKAEGGNLDVFFAKVNHDYELTIKRNSELSDEERRKLLDDVSKRLRDCVLSDILERRTRTDLKKFYQEDLNTQGLTFPEIVGPCPLHYVMDQQLAQLFADTMTIIAPTEADKLETDKYLRYYRYRAIEYFINPENERKHAGRGNRQVSDVAKQLATIMQILLVKRLESSFSAFKTSLLNLRQYTENMIQMWEHNTIFVCPQIDINKELDIEKKEERRGRTVTFQDCVDDIRAKIKKLTDEGRNERGQNAEYCRKDFREEYFELLKEDHRLISNLYDRWASNSQDPKFDAFKENLTPELFNPQKNTSGKLVIFSEAIDTTTDLARAVEAKGYKPLLVTADTRDKLEQIIAENFDANYDGEMRDDYNVIITTEVLAEGVNLHRANVILNYDTPWNATRLMQRIGRVNRIGSREKCVYVYNFMPSDEGDAEIQLVRKAHTKIQSFHRLFGEDSKIFSEDEDVYSYPIAKAVDGDESPLQKYVFELKQYKEAHQSRYEQIAAASDSWQMAQAASGTAYFLVKAPHSARLAIRVREGQGGEVMSLLDLLEEMKVPENTQRADLPDNWQQLCTAALLGYNQYFVRINKTRSNDKATAAKAIIADLFAKYNLPNEAKLLLKNAQKMVKRGNVQIIKKLLAIKLEMENREQSLFVLDIDDIVDILQRELGKLVGMVIAKQGEPQILLGTIK